MTKRRPAGLLVLYDEGRGLRRPEVKIFNPSPHVEREVNEWIETTEGITVHRIDWVPSGGRLGATVTYSRGTDATQALRLVVPGLESLEKRISKKKPMESLAFGILIAGVILGLLGMFLFNVFYPETWYGTANQLMDPQLAVKYTILAIGLAALLIFAGIAGIFRARIT